MPSLLSRILLVILLSSSVARADTFSGAGSSAAAPVYRAWAAVYARSGGLPLSYDPVGSSAGIKRITARETDFGASDVAPSPADLAKAGLVVFPTVITGAVPVVNLPKIEPGQLVLNGDVLARIFLGEITRWDAPEIKALNPKINLPSMTIAVVVRADGSGTTYNFSDYLAKVSATWQKRMGVSTSMKWPANFAGVKGSDGIVAKVAATNGAMGYVDYNYVVENKLNYVRLINAAGAVVSPSPGSFRAALRVSPWQKGDFSKTLTNQSGKESWPITMGTFVLLPKVADHPEQTVRAIQFFTWAFLHGDALANRINFVRLPDLVQAKAFRTLAEVVDHNGNPIGLEGFSKQVQ